MIQSTFNIAKLLVHLPALLGMGRGSKEIEEGSEILDKKGGPSVLDAGIIVAAQKVEHYEIAGYGSVRTFAHLLGQKRAAELCERIT